MNDVEAQQALMPLGSSGSNGIGKDGGLLLYHEGGVLDDCTAMSLRTRTAAPVQLGTLSHLENQLSYGATLKLKRNIKRRHSGCLDPNKYLWTKGSHRFEKEERSCSRDRNRICYKQNTGIANVAGLSSSNSDCC